MMRIATLLVAIGVFLLGGTLRGEVIVDLRKGDDLKMLFDGGFRPWHTPGLEAVSLESGPAEAAVILPDGRAFRLLIKSGYFTFWDGSRISSCRLLGESLSIEQGSALTKKICESISVPVSGLDELTRDALEKANSRKVFDASKQWRSEGVTDGKYSLQISFQPLVGPVKSTASVQILIKWRRLPSERRELTEPIRPPDGYENISMEPPKRDPNQEPFPKYDPDHYKAEFEKTMRQVLPQGRGK